ncbi:hypothetical protein COO60DRAFT_1637574 [Scenedesmus sp. NREL 46B-D3]|nr:hypothetical protein COO60DRAFT_1637574 [Scenedesmus sp. NREL 46B-D3]
MEGIIWEQLAHLEAQSAGPWRLSAADVQQLEQHGDLSGSCWAPLKAVLGLLRSTYATSQQEALVLGPEVYQQLLEGLHGHLQGTSYGRGRGGARAGGVHGPRPPTRAGARRQHELEEQEGQQQQEQQQQQGTLLELELHRVLGRPVAWVMPQDAEQQQQQQQQQAPWEGCPPGLIVFIVASSSGGAAAATAAVAAAQKKQKQQVGQQEGGQGAAQQQQEGEEAEDEEGAGSEGGGLGGSSEAEGSRDDALEAGHREAGTAAGTGDKLTQQPQPLQQKKEKTPQQRQHLSLLLLYNVGALGRVAALNAQERAKQRRELQQQGQEQQAARLLHLDPHRAAPWPCCSGVSYGMVPCSDDVCGEARGRRGRGVAAGWAPSSAAESGCAVVAAPLLAFLEQALNQQGRERRAASGQARGRPSALTELALLTNPQHPHPHLRVLSSPLPPLPHVCRHAPAAVCLCQASVLVAVDWLLASPPDEELLRQREHATAEGPLEVALSPGWYPPTYARLLSEQLRSMAKRLSRELQQQGQQGQRVQSMARLQEEALEVMQLRQPQLSKEELLHRWTTELPEQQQHQRQLQQQQEGQLQDQTAAAEQQLVLSLAILQQFWNDVQAYRAASALLCYPGPLAHAQLLEALAAAGCSDCYINPLVVTKWGQEGTAALVARLKQIQQQRSWKPGLLPSGFSGAQAGDPAAAGSSRAAELHTTAQQQLLGAAMDRAQDIVRLPLAATSIWQHLHRVQQQAVTPAVQRMIARGADASAACNIGELAAYVAQQSTPKRRWKESSSYRAHFKVKPTPPPPAPAAAASAGAAGPGAARQPKTQPGAAAPPAPGVAAREAAACDAAAGRTAAPAPAAGRAAAAAAGTEAANEADARAGRHAARVPAAAAAAAAAATAAPEGRQPARSSSSAPAAGQPPPQLAAAAAGQPPPPLAAAAAAAAGASPAAAEVSPTGVTPVLQEPVLERALTSSPPTQDSTQDDTQGDGPRQAAAAGVGTLVTSTAAAAAAVTVNAAAEVAAPSLGQLRQQESKHERKRKRKVGQLQQQQEQEQEQEQQKRKKKKNKKQQQQQQQQQEDKSKKTKTRRKKRERAEAGASHGGAAGVLCAPTATAAAIVHARPAAAAAAGSRLGQPTLQLQQRQLQRRVPDGAAGGAAAVQPAKPSRSLQARAVSSVGPFSSQQSPSLCSEQQGIGREVQMRPRQLQQELEAADSPSSRPQQPEQQAQQAADAQRSRRRKKQRNLAAAGQGEAGETVAAAAKERARGQR